MRIPLVIILISCFVGVKAQTTIVAMPGQYVEAHNYGGKVEFKRFLQQEMNYPLKALTNKTEGTVEVSAIIDYKTGKPSKIHIKTSVSKALDKEAMRLYKMLLFVPSYYLGDRVTTYGTLKFKFSTKQYKRYCKKRGYQNILLNGVEVDSLNTIYKDNQVNIKPKIIFKDTLDNISSFIQKNIKYPEGTLRLNITGVVKLFFVVEPTGRITNIKALKNLGGGATSEAIRLLKLTHWNPAKKDGKGVRVSKQFEVNFNLSNESGMDYVPTSY